MKPPIPKSHLITTVHLSDERRDNFSWLKNSNNPDVMEYLRLENAYAHHHMASTKTLQEQLLEEMNKRVPPEQSTAPYFIEGWERYARIRQEQDYWVYCRSKDQCEEILLDENERAKDQDYYALDDLSLSPNQQWMAWSEDLNGQERFKLQLRNLNTGETSTVQHSNIKWSIAWLDNHRLVYVGGDEADRPCEVRIQIFQKI